MARTRGQNNIAKPIRKFSPSLNAPASKKPKAKLSASAAAAQDSTSGTKSKRKGKSRKTKEPAPAQVEEQPEDGPQAEQDAAGSGSVVSAIRDEREAPESLPEKAKSNKARGKRQNVGAELDRGPTGAYPVEGAAEASSSAVDTAADEEDNEPASSGSKATSKAEASSKASKKPAKPRKRVIQTPKTTGAEAEKDGAQEGDDGAGPSGSNHEANPSKASKGPEKITKQKNRAAESTRGVEPRADDHKAGDRDDGPGSSAAQTEEAAAKPESASKSEAKSTRTKKKANQASSAAEKSILDENGNEAGAPASKGKTDSESASRNPPTKNKPSKKVAKPKAPRSKAAQSATEEEDGKPTSAAPATRAESKAAVGNATGAEIHATTSKVKRSKKSARKDRTEASPDSISKTALTEGRNEKKVPTVDEIQHDTARNSGQPQDEPRGESNKNVRKPRKRATTSKTTGSKRGADKSKSKKPSTNKILGPTAASNRGKRKRLIVGDTNDETGPEHKQQDEGADDGNSRSKRSRSRVAAPEPAGKKVVGNSRALAGTKAPDEVDDPVGAKRKRGRGRPPKKSGKSDADANSGEGSSAAAKGRGKARRKLADTTYRHRGEDEDGDEARLSGDAEDDEGKGGPRKKRRVQDPTYRPDADAWSEPSPLSEQNARVHPVRDRNSKGKVRDALDTLLHNAGYVGDLLPPSERALNRSPDFDKRGKLGWHPSSRKKREGPGRRKGEVTKAARGKTAQAESGDNDDPADDTRKAPSSAPEGDRRQGADASQTSGSEEGEAEHRSDRTARLRASRLDGGGARSSAGLSSQADDTTSQPSKRDKPEIRMNRTAQTLPPRRPGDGKYRSQAGPAPQPSGVRGVSGLSIPSVQPNTLKRPRKTAVELRKEERHRKWEAKRRRTETPDSADEETSSEQHPTVSFEDPAPGSQEDEAPREKRDKRRHSSTVFASLTDPRRIRSWPTIENPASRRVPAETTNPPSPESASGNPQSEPSMSMSRMMSVAIPAMAIRDDAWSEVLRASSTTSSGIGDISSSSSSSSDTQSSRTSSAAALARPKKDTFMDATINTAYNMFYRLSGIPWRSTIKGWREELVKERAAEKRRERDKAKKAAAGEADKSRKGKGRVTKSTRSRKPAAAKKGKGKQEETTPEAEAGEGVGWEEEEEELEEQEEQDYEEAAAGQEFVERTGGSMNTRKDSHGNVFTITQTTTTVKTPERSRSAANSISPQARQAASILGTLEHSATAEVSKNLRQTTPLRQHGGQDGTGPSPRTLLLAQHMTDLRRSGEGLLQARDDDGGGGSGGESPLLGSDFDARSEGRSTEGEAPDEALGEDEGGGLTEDQGTTEDEGREVQTPGEGDEGPLLLGGGMFRMAQRLIGKGNSGREGGQIGRHV